MLILLEGVKVKKMKFNIFLVVLFALNILGNNTLFSQITNDTLENEYSVYAYKKVENAYIITVIKLINNEFYTLVSLTDGDTCANKIISRGVYKLKMKPYHKREQDTIYDWNNPFEDITILLEGKKIKFNTGSSFRFDIYTSPNLKGLCIIDG